MNIAKHGRFLTFLSLVAMTSVCGAATTPTGRVIRFYEGSSGKFVNFVMPGAICTPSSLTICISLNELGSATFPSLEIATVNVRASTGRSVICAATNGHAAYTFRGRSTVGEEVSSITISYRYEIQSAVLNDPALINPRTGLPFNGKLVSTTTSALVDQEYLGPQQRLAKNQRIGFFDCGTPLITHSMLTVYFGLSSADAERMMSQAMTIRMLISGNLVATDGATYSTQMRAMGD